MTKDKKQKIWLMVSETINTGNYNSVKIEAGFSKVYDKENPTELIDSDMDALLQVIQKKAKRIRKKNEK